MRTKQINLLGYLQHERTIWDDVIITIASILVMGTMLAGMMHMGIKQVKQLQKTERRARATRARRYDEQPDMEPDRDEILRHRKKYWPVLDDTEAYEAAQYAQ